MHTTAGLWIDHHKAVIVIVSTEGEETLEIRSQGWKPTEHTHGVRSSVPGEAEPVAAGELRRFYDVVVGAIHGADSILIFGPGEAKRELCGRLEHAKLDQHIIAMQIAKNMTARQVAAKVHEYFHN